MRKLFHITKETCTMGFQEHATLNIRRPIEGQLNRRTLFFRKGLDKGNVLEIKKIIERNSSLRVGFGWSFESEYFLNKILEDCEKEIKRPFTEDIITITSDLRCDWIGFVPFNAFDAEYYKDLCIEDLIVFNNRLINYQTDVVKFISNHPLYRYHALLRDDSYRFEYFKQIRKDPLALSEAFQYYLDALESTTGIIPIPRDFVEEMIGCHYLYHPEVFFELLEFNILKGYINE